MSPDARRRHRWLNSCGIAIAIAASGCIATPAVAASTCFSSFCTPAPPAEANTAVASAFAQLDLGSRFLHFLGDQGSALWQGAPNAGGGGADKPPSDPVYRSWVEGYGVGSRSDPQTNFAGDTRSSLGVVAGLGMKVAPNAMIGLSVDQSHTKVDVRGLPQSARFDFTQVGLNGVYEMGPWTFSAAAVYGFAAINSDRDTPAGTVSADYKARMWGGIAETSYYYGWGTNRIVPKIGVDALRVDTDAFQEVGNIFAASVSSQTAGRVRLFAATEIGHTFVLDKALFDLSAYGRLVDIVWQEIPNLNVSAAGGGPTNIIQGAVESRFGVDAGVMASYRVNTASRVYAGYDGRFRDNFQSHGGTLGVEIRW